MHVDAQASFKIDAESTEVKKKLAAVQAAWNMGAKIKASDAMDLIGRSLPQSGDEVLFNWQVVSAAPPGANDASPPEPSSDEDLQGALSQADDPGPSTDADPAATIALAARNLVEKMGGTIEEERRRKFGPLMDVAT